MSHKSPTNQLQIIRSITTMPSSKSARGGIQEKPSGKPTILQQPKTIEGHHETQVARMSNRSRTSKALFDNS